MRTNQAPTCLSIISILLIVSTLSFSCGKDNIPRNNISDDEESGLPGVENPYIAYYVMNNITVDNPHYLAATSIDNFVLSKRNDTSSFTLRFTNALLKSDNTHTNNWIFCDSSYDINGADEFDFICRWTGDSTATLTPGKTYNLNEMRDNKAVPVTETNGYVSYNHFHTNSILVVSLNSISGVNEPEALNSYLTITKVENNTASGTFSLAFGCTANGNSGNAYSNYVKGVFNKIPITQ